MLTPELKKLKEQLLGKRSVTDNVKLLKELEDLDNGNMEILCESLAMSKDVCPTCGRKLSN